MALCVKDKKLKKKIYKLMNVLDNKASKEYKKSNFKKGKKFELMSDRLYKKNYKKMWKIC